MAILFSMQTPQGGVVDYHTISSMVIDPESETTAIQLVSYISQAAYDDGFQSIQGPGFTFQGVPNGDQVAWAENQIISRPEWAGATIV